MPSASVASSEPPSGVASAAPRTASGSRMTVASAIAENITDSGRVPANLYRSTMPLLA